MQQLIATIENLLIEHDCVVVPGLGGFIHNHQEAYYDEKRALFFPSGKQLSFNARLYYNDGLLCQAYQIQFGLSFEAANQRIRQAVAELKESLSEHHYVSIGRLGHFTQHHLHEALVFEPALRNDLCALSFGLKACAFPTSVSSVETQREHASPWLSYVATIAACFLLLFTFIQDNDHLNRVFDKELSSVQLQESAVLPLCSLKSIDMAHTEPAMISQAVQEAKVAPATSVEPAIVVEPATAPTTTTTPTKETAIETQHSEADFTDNALLNYPSDQKQFLIVIASFPTAEQAEQYIHSRHLQEQYPSVGVAVSAERCRVYAQAYSSKSEALSHLEAFRQAHPKYAKAWVLVH